MGISNVNGKCEAERKQAAAASRKPVKVQTGTAAKAKEEPALKVTMPEDLGDYKGARKQLRHAVKAVVKANTARLARKMVEKAQDGDIRGAEMMLSLIEKKKAGKEGKKKKRDGPSWAELLASEPEWDDEKDGTANRPKAAKSASGAAGERQ